MQSGSLRFKDRIIGQLLSRKDMSNSVNVYICKPKNDGDKTKTKQCFSHI